MDLAGKEFWDSFWRRQDGRRFVGLSHFQSQMGTLLSRYAVPGASVCEIGCGGSTWMPPLAARGVDMWGIDYSDVGISLARANLERRGVSAHLIKADVRDVDALPRDRFDVIFSSGFIEHFDDASEVMRGLARAVRPGGVIITLVPNFAGPWGRMQRLVDRELLELHTIYTDATLDAMHLEAGLTVRQAAAFFGGFGPLVVNYTRPLGPAPQAVRATFIGAVWTLQQLGAWTLAMVGLRDSAAYSSHLAGVYERRDR
jgi:2-polyprenyl-3-methyl-5-hydroxy-6-metoxy-1,4-benzoquinol methylase